MRAEENNLTDSANHTSTTTLVAEETGTQRITIYPVTDIFFDKEKAALKLDRIKDKSSRYESHNDFISRCLAEKVIPNRLKIELEPTIGNHDQEFLDEWYQILDQTSFTLINKIVKFCEKTVVNATTDIKAIELSLKKNMEKEEFEKIEDAINQNDEANKRMLKQRKFKKFNYLKHNPKKEVKQQPNVNTKIQKTNQLQNKNKLSYAGAVQNNMPPIQQTSNTLKSTNGRQTLQQQLQSLHPANQPHKRSKSPYRNKSKTNQAGNSDEITR